MARISLDTRLKWLRPILVTTGTVFVGAGVLMLAWPSGWRWEPHQPMYEQMVLGTYATLGVFLIIGARDPMRSLSLIWFAVWSSFVHAAIMFVQALSGPLNRGHLIGDVPGLLILAIVLAVLTPRRGSIADSEPAQTAPDSA